MNEYQSTTPWNTCVFQNMFGDLSTFLRKHSSSLTDGLIAEAETSGTKSCFTSTNGGSLTGVFIELRHGCVIKLPLGEPFNGLTRSLESGDLLKALGLCLTNADQKDEMKRQLILASEGEKSYVSYIIP